MPPTGPKRAPLGSFTNQLYSPAGAMGAGLGQGTTGRAIIPGVLGQIDQPRGFEPPAVPNTKIHSGGR